MKPEHFDRNPEKFSVVKRCPRCGGISLAAGHGRIICKSCGYEEKFHSIE